MHRDELLAEGVKVDTREIRVSSKMPKKSSVIIEFVLIVLYTGSMMGAMYTAAHLVQNLYLLS